MLFLMNSSGLATCVYGRQSCLHIYCISSEEAIEDSRLKMISSFCFCLVWLHFMCDSVTTKRLMTFFFFRATVLKLCNTSVALWWGFFDNGSFLVCHHNLSQLSWHIFVFI